MAQPRSWLNEVIEVIQLLGGEAHYEDIYRLIYERQIINFEDNPNWQAAVRQNIEMHSSDSAAYSGKKNIFYTVAGKGRGIWGLRPSYVRRNDDVVPLEVLDKKQELGRQSARQLSDEQLKAKAEEMQSGMPRKRKASAPA
ncbi:MAG: hypothetical protein ACLSS9_06755 [Acutalibacteraceae bacterium]